MVTGLYNQVNMCNLIALNDNLQVGRSVIIYMYELCLILLLRSGSK